jgi:putative tricarboxylic transport membrane protein
LGFLTVGPPLERYAFRGIVFVAASILVFAYGIRPLGLVLASFLTFMVSAIASKETRWLEATIMAVALTTFCVVLFVYLLNLPFQLWPEF